MKPKTHNNFGASLQFVTMACVALPNTGTPKLPLQNQMQLQIAEAEIVLADPLVQLGR
jgi:hypothetical protein